MNKKQEQYSTLSWYETKDNNYLDKMASYPFSGSAPFLPEINQFSNWSIDQTNFYYKDIDSTQY